MRKLKDEVSPRCIAKCRAANGWHPNSSSSLVPSVQPSASSRELNADLSPQKSSNSHLERRRAIRPRESRLAIARWIGLDSYSWLVSLDGFCSYYM